MFSKQDQIQGYDDALLAAMNAEEQRLLRWLRARR
jgi:glycine hydroxymethyltransferase